ncbi:glucokinase [Thiomicrorhabdus sp. Milos-T2]|uniref:glucokinase n=1 Tax=Thiomicrorhabdus sp. Milos-T2 TaxID=90814 RepID=UPI00056FA10E|nr:glucokinase [Thiomicrorhabdus sp. Milos-T2]
MYYLAGDIGGTKALLQLIKINAENNTHITCGQKRFLCHKFDSLESIISSFIRPLNISNLVIESACFGLPGPVNGSKVKLTNLPWIVDAHQIEKTCSIQKVHFVNDFYAAALGVDTLTGKELVSLYSQDISSKVNEMSVPMPTQGNRLVVGAGTGLGVAPVYFDGKQFLPQNSEGGHFEFAPISDTQQILLQWLWQQWEHVSYERVLSGPGLETLYAFFIAHDLPTTYSETSSQNLNKNTLHSRQDNKVGLDFTVKDFDLSQKNLNAEQISQAAGNGDPVAIKALLEFVTIYGAFIGAVALVWPAQNGIYLAGGIAVKILDWMQKPYFKKAFLEKGRMTQIVERTPVYLVTDESLGLRGAMRQNQITSGLKLS